MGEWVWLPFQRIRGKQRATSHVLIVKNYEHIHPSSTCKNGFQVPSHRHCFLSWLNKSRSHPVNVDKINGSLSSPVLIVEWGWLLEPRKVFQQKTKTLFSEVDILVAGALPTILSNWNRTTKRKGGENNCNYQTTIRGKFRKGSWLLVFRL